MASPITYLQGPPLVVQVHQTTNVGNDGDALTDAIADSGTIQSSSIFLTDWTITGNGTVSDQSMYSRFPVQISVDDVPANLPQVKSWSFQNKFPTNFANLIMEDNLFAILKFDKFSKGFYYESDIDGNIPEFRDIAIINGDSAVSTEFVAVQIGGTVGNFTINVHSEGNDSATLPFDINRRYYLTVLADFIKGKGKLNVYDADTWVLIGALEVPIVTGNKTLSFSVGATDGHVDTNDITEGSMMHFNRLVYNTDGVFPLLPKFFETTPPEEILLRSSYIGEMKMFGGSTAPTNWIFCDGQSLVVADNQKLFDVIGFVFGGSGLNFNVPDLRGRTAIGEGTGPSLTARALGATGGTETHTLVESEIPAHNHAINGSTTSGDEASPANNFLAASTNTYIDTLAPSGALGDATISNTGGDDPHENMQPFVTVNFIICTDGVQP